MRSTRTSVITVSNNRVSCRPHLEQKLRTLLRCNRYTCALLPDWTLAIVTSCLEQLNLFTKASMITRYHCDIIASCSEVPCARWCASQRSWTPCHLQQLIWEQTNTRIERLGAHASNSAGRFMPLVYYNMWDCIFQVQRGWKCLLDGQEQDGRDGSSVRAMRYEFPRKYGEFVSCYNGNNDWSLLVLFVPPLGSRSNAYIKTLATLGFWLHYSPCSLRYWTNDTLAARSSSPQLTPITIPCHILCFYYDSL